MTNKELIEEISIICTTIGNQNYGLAKNRAYRLLEKISQTREETSITPREMAIYAYRHGISYYGYGADLPVVESHTLEETGIKFGVTRERIRQIECKTNAKLKKNLDQYDD